MAIPIETNLQSEAEYLAMEEVAEVKSEFHNGEVLAMFGGTVEHSKITMNAGVALTQALKGTPCSAYDSNLKVKIESKNSFVYPDATVICGKPERYEKSEHVVKNPVVIVEVLSDSTGAYDRGEKFHFCQQISTFKEYILIEQKTPQIDVFYKNDDGKWMLESYFGLDATIELRALNIKIPMAEIYERVEFGAR